MRLIIEQKDFKGLSAATQAELIEQFTGRKLLPEASSTKSRDAKLYWRKPVDLTPDLTSKLLHGLGENHRKRLEIFARNGGRASMKKLLAVTGDNDWHVLSHFQTVMTRRLRRLIEDPEKKAEIIKWDFDSTKWDRDGKTIVDGVYYMSEVTAATLQDALAANVKSGRKKGKGPAGVSA